MSIDPGMLKRLDDLRHCVLEQRGQAIASLQGQLGTATGSDEELRFLIECELAEIMDKSPMDAAVRRDHRQEAIRQLAHVQDGYPRFARHPYLLFLELRLMPDLSAPGYPDDATCELASSILRDRLLDGIADAFPPQLDRSLGAMVFSVLQNRCKRDLRASRPPLGEFEIMSGIQALDRLRDYATPAWLNAAQAGALKAFIIANGQADRYRETIRKLDGLTLPAPAAVMEAAAHGPVAPAPAPVAEGRDPSAASERDPRSLRPWAIACCILGSIMVLFALVVGISSMRSRVRPG